MHVNSASWRKKDNTAINFENVSTACIFNLTVDGYHYEDEGGNWSTWRHLLTCSRNCHKLKPGNSSPGKDSTSHSSISSRHLDWKAEVLTLTGLLGLVIQGVDCLDVFLVNDWSPHLHGWTCEHKKTKEFLIQRMKKSA